MKHRFPSLFLTGALVLSLAACTPTGEAEVTPPSSQEVSLPPASPTPGPFGPAGHFSEADSLPLGRYTPWQKAYMDFLSRNNEEESALRLWAESATSAEIDAQPERWESYNMCSERYWLYDVDKDGIPELFVRCGNSEAAYQTVCYTYREDAIGSVADIGIFPSGHSTLCTYPGENGFLLLWAHMGAAYADRYAIEDGELVNKGQVYSAGLDAAQMGDSPEPEEIWEGSEAIPSYYTRANTRNPLSPALLLPICDYDRSLQQAPSLTEEATVRDTIGKVLWDETAFISVSGDGYYGGVGTVTLEEFLQPGAAYPYNDTALAVREQAWADANGDGQTDCILRLEDTEGNGSTAQFYLVLSLQEEQVYGYFFAYMEDAAVDPDGSVYFRLWNQWHQMSFYKDQCYIVPSADPVVGDGLAWDPFSGAKS